MDKLKRAICDCGNVYVGDYHYYNTQYCSCGKWLHWDRHSNIGMMDNQYQTDIDIRDYNEEEWAL